MTLEQLTELFKTKGNEVKVDWQNNPENPSNLSQSRLESWKKELKALEQVYAIKPKPINRRTNKIHFRNKRNNRKPKLVSRTLHRYEKIM